MTLTAAAREIATKSLRQIHVETAKTWADRALVYRRKAERADKNGLSEVACKHWRNFDDARHEALEHAALAEDEGKTVGRIERRIDRKRRRR